MIFLVLLALSQCDLVVKEGEYFLHMFVFNGNYTIISRTGRVNFTRYSYEIEQNVHLRFSKQHFIYNNRNVNIVASNGTVSPPTLVKQLFSTPACDNSSYPTYIEVSEPPLYQCHNFTIERVAQKILIGILVLIIIAVNASKIKDVIGNTYRNSKGFIMRLLS